MRGESPLKEEPRTRARARGTLSRPAESSLGVREGVRALGRCGDSGVPGADLWWISCFLLGFRNVLGLRCDLHRAVNQISRYFFLQYSEEASTMAFSLSKASTSCYHFCVISLTAPDLGLSSSVRMSASSTSWAVSRFSLGRGCSL